MMSLGAWLVFPPLLVYIIYYTFLTTDDRVLRIASRHTAHLKVRVANPLD